MIADYIQSTKKILDSFKTDEILLIKDKIMSNYKSQNNIYVFGNGGSGSTASHFVCDINKGVSLGLDKRIKMTCLNDNMPLITAYSNDQSYDDIFIEQLRNFLTPDDLVIAFSGSGMSPNVVKGISYAIGVGAFTIGLTGDPGGRLAELSDHSLIVNTKDMQHIEDTHLLITHILMKLLYKQLHGKFC